MFPWRVLETFSKLFQTQRWLAADRDRLQRESKKFILSGVFRGLKNESILKYYHCYICFMIVGSWILLESGGRQDVRLLCRAELHKLAARSATYAVLPLGQRVLKTFSKPQAFPWYWKPFQNTFEPRSGGVSTLRGESFENVFKTRFHEQFEVLKTFWSPMET